MNKFWVKIGSFLAVLCIALLVIGWENYKVAYNEPVDLFGKDTVDADQLESGLAVDSTLSELMECFGAKETILRTRRGAESQLSVKYYYIMPISVKSGETYYVAFEANNRSSDMPAYERIVEATMNVIRQGSSSYSFSAPICGGLVSLDEETYQYMVEWFEEENWFEQEGDLEKYVLPLMFRPMEPEKVKTMLYFAICMGALSIISFVYAFTGDKAKKSKRPKLKIMKKGIIRINGIRCDARRMLTVNESITKGDLEKAKRELVTLYNTTEEEADIIIKKWKSIFR